MSDRPGPGVGAVPRTELERSTPLLALARPAPLPGPPCDDRRRGRSDPYVRDWQSASGHSGPPPANQLPEFVREPPRAASPDEQAQHRDEPAEHGHQAPPSSSLARKTSPRIESMGNRLHNQPEQNPSPVRWTGPQSVLSMPGFPPASSAPATPDLPVRPGQAPPRERGSRLATAIVPTTWPSITTPTDSVAPRMVQAPPV